MALVEGRVSERIYIIFRVHNLGRENLNAKIYVDPESHRGRSLMFADPHGSWRQGSMERKILSVNPGTLLTANMILRIDWLCTIPRILDVSFARETLGWRSGVRLMGKEDVMRIELSRRENLFQSQGSDLVFVEILWRLKTHHRISANPE